MFEENGVLFACDLPKGQKTGSFLDQRENHFAARRYASGDVLDCFSYQGGFALTVADRCEHVEGIEMAPAAIEAARRNQQLNGISNVHFREGNTFDLLKEYDEAGRRFHMIILDPPAFAKNRDSIPAAQRGLQGNQSARPEASRARRLPHYLLLLLPHYRAAVPPDCRRGGQRRSKEA